MASAAALPAAEGYADPGGCMVLLSAVGDEGQAGLGEQVRARRAGVLERIRARIARAVEAGELPPGTDVAGTARFWHAVQGGLSLQARDGAGRADLEAAARAAMAGWSTADGGPA